MHSNTADTPKKPEAKIVIDEYARMETGGWVALGLGVIGVTVLLCVGILTKVVLPTGFASLTMGLFLSGCILLVGRLVLRKQDQVRVELEDHKADHAVAQIDTEDIATIKTQVGDILAILARMDLEQQEERRMVGQVEEFMTWRANAFRRLTDAAEKAAADPSVNSQRDAAWLADMAEALEIGREIERRRPPE